MSFRLVDDLDWLIITLSLFGLELFFVITLGVALFHANTLFLDVHGYGHRLCGAALFLWLVYGCTLIHSQTTIMTILSSDTGENSSSTSSYNLNEKNQVLLYDVILGSLGVTTTLTAARDFPHRYIRNAIGQSGTLSEKAMVTQAEMIEHSFYQGLNLVQILYLHLLARWSYTCTTRAETIITSSTNGASGNGRGCSSHERFAALCIVTVPWLMRGFFPVNSFSNNWKQTEAHKNEQRAVTTKMEIILYQIKKAQYLFYKHVVLHGINLSLCVRPTDLVYTLPWRIFWICLNASYVMEFFLQSLVKRRVMSQASMLSLNRLLVAVSSLAALPAVATIVRWDACIVSLILNLVHRHHDVINTLFLATVLLAQDHFSVLKENESD